jgi:hypothetical protein
MVDELEMIWKETTLDLIEYRVYSVTNDSPYLLWIREM